MKKLSILFFLAIILIGCDPSNNIFEKVGYYKSNDNLRYFTFHVRDYESIDSQNIPADLKTAIKKHGSHQINTQGKVTASFYYIKLGQAPDISGLSAQQANDVAHSKKPIMSVWIMPSGKVNVIENPQ